MLMRLLFIALPGAYMMLMMRIGGIDAGASAAVSIVLAAASMTWIGSALLRAGRVAPMRAPLLAAFVVGTCACSVGAMGIALLFRLPAAIAVLLAIGMLGIVAALAQAFTRRRADRNASPSVQPASPSVWPASSVTRRWSATPMADLLLALLAAVLLAWAVRLPVASPIALAHTGVLPIWTDYYLHGAVICGFGCPNMAGLGDAMLVGVSPVFYHYASLLLPAALGAVSDATGLQLATSVMLPLGLLLGALGLCVFAAELGGILAAAAALVCVIGLPDPSAYGLRSGLFDFPWLMITAPGSGYAIGLAGVICAVLVRPLREAGKAPLLFIAVALAAMVFIRAHMVLLLAPAVFVLLALQAGTGVRRWLSAGAAAIGLLFVVVMVQPEAQRRWLALAHADQYLRIALGTFDGSAPLARWLAVDLGAAAVAGAGVAATGDAPRALLMLGPLLCLIASLGAAMIVYPLVLVLRRRASRLLPIDALPLLLMLVYLGLIWFAPTAGNGDLTEFKHRHFVLLYALVAGYGAARLGAWAGARSAGLTTMLIVLVALVAMIANRDVNPARPRIASMPWGSDYFDRGVDVGLLPAAAFIRERSRRGDVLAMDLSASQADLNAPLAQLVALAGVPAYLARIDLQTRSACARALIAGRAQTVREVGAATQWESARERLRRDGVRWYVTPAGRAPGWDPTLKSAAFTSRGLAVYDAGSGGRVDYDRLAC